MIARHVVLTITASLLAGCAVRSDLMSPTGERAEGLRPAPEKALVVFVRPAYVGDAIQAVIASALADSRLVTANDDGRRWAERNRPSVVEKKDAYEPKWLEKGDRPTLRPDDGTVPASP